ncbi:response regulator [Chryseolinea sp. T2]|uniref:response regulator n=1 Tax=Chryseolinea sp. T2 TaxID=3129255 RepID=UPI0030772493
MKILVAHRRKQTVEAIRSVLCSVNPVVLHTESGLDGLLTSRIEHFDLIICGTDLPVVTGFEMIRSLRTNSINRETPVIFLANDANEPMLHLCRALGALAVLDESSISSELAPIVMNKVASKPDQVWEPLSTPVRSLYY